MRHVLAAVALVVATPLAAQVTTPAPSIPSKEAATCRECGVVRSIRSLKKEMPSTQASEAKPSGLVASIPLGKGGGNPKIGPSQKIGKDAVPVTETWEVTVRLDDGRFRILTLGEKPDLKEGDKVRVEADGKINPRD